MAIPAWYWPPSGATARGTALVPFGSGVAVADWLTPTLWPFTQVGATLLPQPGIVLATGTPGFGAAAPDGVGGVFAVTWDGMLYRQPYGGGATSAALPSGQVYVGCAAPNATGFVLSSVGNVYVKTPPPSLRGSWPTSARFLTVSGTTLATILAGSGIGTMDAPTGVTGSVSTPPGMTSMSCIALASGYPLGTAGWLNAPPLSRAAAVALDPQVATTMLAVGSGSAWLWQAPSATSENWSQTQTLSGLVNLSCVGWRPDGTQALAGSTSSGVVQVIGYSVGIMSLHQTLSVSGACSVAVAGDSTHALVAQSGQACLLPLVYGGSTWATGTAVTGVAGVTQVLPFGLSGAVATCTSGIAFLSLVAGTWSLSSVTSLPFAPSVIATDLFGQIYAAGSGSLAVTSGTLLLGSGSWSGSTPTGIAVQQGRAIMTVPSDGAYYEFGESSLVPQTWTQMGSGTLALGSPVGLGLSQTVLFMMGSGATKTFGFSGTPFALTPVVSGLVSQWNGTSWVATALGIGHNPSACSYDASGNLWVVTEQNTIWSIASGGSVLSSGTIPQYPLQSSTAPLGASSVLSSSGHVFVATSIPGVVVEVT